MAAPPVKLYGPPMSTAVARVLACLHEKEVQFQLVPLDMSKGEHKMPDYLKLQPFGQVPAFEDGSITLFESRAISRYVCEKYASQGNKSLFGTNPLEKASIDQWLEAEGHNFHPPSAFLILRLLYAPMLKLSQDENAMKENQEKLEKVLDVYEKRLGECRFLAGDEFTLADLSHLPNIHYLVNNAKKEELFSSRKNVWRWWGEISGRESWKKVLEKIDEGLALRR
ncbi:glutathione S-transferase PARB-like [Andrographis paniculata]|uniref:glutathione S-transferase PARB-like n=1 Tax=Andrographis paniculata TaxID=175694 RepID=UPI0021E962B9|nr:glutathione S-transferase PARB-like [Andrographis paniculata]